MALDGQQYQRIHDALLDGYDETTLQLMVRFEMEEDLDRVVGPGNLTKRMYELVGWADRTGRVEELVQAAYNYNQGNETLAALYAEWFAPKDAADHGRAQSASFYRRSSLPTAAKTRNSCSGYSASSSRPTSPSGRMKDLRVGTKRWTARSRAPSSEPSAWSCCAHPMRNNPSGWNNEIQYARTLGRRIYPVLASGEPHEAIPLSLFGAQRIDARKDYDRAISDDCYLCCVTIWVEREMLFLSFRP